MTITKLEKYKGSTWLVEINSDTTVFLHKSIISENSLYEDMEISSDKMNEIIYQSQKRKSWEYSLYLLDVRDYSYTEMFDKLSKKYSDTVCYETMEKLCSLSMIDDRRYAENLARKLMEVKKYGYYRARSEMQRKGIDRELCDEMLSLYEDNENERLLALIERKYASKLSGENGITKVKNALVRQGYGFESINRAIEQYLEENE